jgi:uncharacterized membrane protein YfcA
MEIIGFILGILIGISLGLIGSGGSIFTIPILVYLLHIPPSKATVYSLFIVGVSSLIGSIKGAKSNLLDYKIALFFGLPSIVSILIMRKIIMPYIPNTIGVVHNFVITKDHFIMLLFAILMIIASFSMIKSNTVLATNNQVLDKKSIISKGILVGLVTGFLGVGGGFLIIPTLLFSAKLPMKNAVTTSLVIIACNSLMGFMGSINSIEIEWNFLLLFTSFSVVGIFVGMLLSKKISNETLKPIFGWFILVTGIYILVKELFLK